MRKGVEPASSIWCQQLRTRPATSSINQSNTRDIALGPVGPSPVNRQPLSFPAWPAPPSRTSLNTANCTLPLRTHYERPYLSPESTRHTATQAATLNRRQPVTSRPVTPTHPCSETCTAPWPQKNASPAEPPAALPLIAPIDAPQDLQKVSSDHRKGGFRHFRDSMENLFLGAPQI